MDNNLADIVLPTGGVDTWITFAEQPQVWGTGIACLIVAAVVISIWRNLPKGVLVFVVVVALIAAGVLAVKS